MNPRVGIIMGSTSDDPTMAAAAEALREFDVPFEYRVVSAHRTPEAMVAAGMRQWQRQQQADDERKAAKRAARKAAKKG